jgi:hypothetical protein
MGMNTFRYHRWRERIGGDARPGAAGPGRRWSLRHGAERERNPLAAMYWRRRLVALALGLSVLAVIAWAFNGAIGGAATSGPSAASGSGAGGSGSGSGAGSGSGSGSGSGGARGSGAAQQQDLGGGGGGHGGVGGTGGSSASPGATSGPGDSSGSGSGQSGTTATPGPCPHGAVVLSLINAQPTYGPGELPQFTVDVVGTGRQTCSFNVGASRIALIIRSGSERVWSSADCVQGAGDLVTDLQRGVPTVLPISWNRQPSAPGCHAQSGSVPDGTYTATAADGWLQSNTITFRIT